MEPVCLPLPTAFPFFSELYTLRQRSGVLFISNPGCCFFCTIPVEVDFLEAERMIERKCLQIGCGHLQMNAPGSAPKAFFHQSPADGRSHPLPPIFPVYADIVQAGGIFFKNSKSAAQECPIFTDGELKSVFPAAAVRPWLLLFLSTPSFLVRDKAVPS